MNMQTITSLEEGINPLSPLGVSRYFVGEEDDYNYGQVGKAFLHIWGVPFLLAFLDIQYSLTYIVAVSFLYSTVFRKKSEEFFGVLSFSIIIIAFFVLSIL